MAKKRSQINEQEFPKSNILSRTTETEPQQSRDRGRKQKRLAGRATYDLTPALKKRVVELATDLGIPASQLALFMLCDALRRLEQGDIDPKPYLTKSSSPKFRNELALDEWYWLE